MSGEQYEELTTAVLDNLQQADKGLLLDAGCGYGRVSSQLLQKDLETRIVGVDASPAMIEGSKELERTGRFSTVLGAMEHLPFRSDSFDSIVCIGVMTHVSDDGKALQELTRVLKPGGRMIFTFLNRSNPFWVPFAINAKVGKLAGFKLNFRFPAFYVQALRDLGFDVRLIHPGFLVPGEAWLINMITLARAFNKLSVIVPSRFGYEPVLEALHDQSLR